MTETPTPRRVRCTNHCGGCHLHFHSLEAFDAHREGDHALAPGTEEGRHCVHPLDKKGPDGRTPFIALTTVGVCEAYPDDVRTGVAVWTLARSVERARALRSRSGQSELPLGSTAEPRGA